MDLVTLLEYKTYKNLTTPNHDTEIAGLLPKVSALVRTYCNRSFTDYVTKAKSEYFNGGQPKLILAEWPVITIDSVEFSSDYGITYTTLTENIDWVLDGGYIYATNKEFPKYLRGYKVTYKAGYASVPDDLKLAVMDLVSYYRQNDAAIHSNKAPGTNTVQIEYISTTTLPAHIRRILDLYKADYT